MGRVKEELMKQEESKQEVSIHEMEFMMTVNDIKQAVDHLGAAIVCRIARGYEEEKKEGNKNAGN